MLVKMINNCIYIERNNKKYIIIDKSGQINLKNTYQLLKDNIGDKANIVHNIDFDDSIKDDLRNGLNIFLNDLFIKFDQSEFSFED